MVKYLFGYKYKKIKSSFTLLELTIVIIIIALLASIAFPHFTKVLERAKVSSAKAKLAIIRRAEGIYFSIHDTYTDNFEELAEEVPEVAEEILEEDEDWEYRIVFANRSGFLAEAERKKGDYEGYVIAINEVGKFEGTHPLK